MSGSEILDTIFTTNSVSAGVFFCALCSKPFSQETALKRHVSYCRRTKDRPRSRPKPCRECSAAKHKCSLQARCTRCTKKGLDCTYAENRTQEPTASTEALNAQVWAPSLLGLDSANPQSIFAPEASTFDHQVRWDPFSQMIELPDEVAFGNFPLTEPGLGHITEDLVVGDTYLSPSPEPYRQILPHSVNLGRRVTSNTSWIVFPLQFIKEPKAAANGSANMIKQALRSYPEMMLRRSTFPPFIHQYQDKSHLPEPLANCMGIAILFVSRNPDTSSFLWQSIRKEQDRNLSEVGIVHPALPDELRMLTLPNRWLDIAKKTFSPQYKQNWYISSCVSSPAVEALLQTVTTTPTCCWLMRRFGNNSWP
ncbi:hypothetical protein HER10_EVM0005040 [Colletotrichum scovillei]|uniref:uncharacterized protein n=1 Tax=Colletotrichum scovillei TaxID=1209932 RepID=UPI0015C38ADF|nr:uncharacterized protein HER10_EVM0005040 [Colletotrichum scovillei]KAF4772899.1 hypothetical protein HER10_EVM0005040 [Colletotrichum scovillei]